MRPRPLGRPVIGEQTNHSLCSSFSSPSPSWRHGGVGVPGPALRGGPHRPLGAIWLALQRHRRRVRGAPRAPGFCALQLLPVANGPWKLVCLSDFSINPETLSQVLGCLAIKSGWLWDRQLLGNSWAAPEHGAEVQWGRSYCHCQHCP